MGSALHADSSSTNWGATVAVDANSNSGQVDLGIDQTGAAIAATRANAATGMRYRRYTPGVGWSASTQTIPHFADFINETWLLAMGPNGGPIAVAVDENPPGVLLPVGDLLAVRFE